MQILLKKVLLPICLVLVLAFGLSFFYPINVYSGSGTPITGWMWSDNIGWISMNCSDTSSCGTSNYGMSVNPGGVITGYAWSDTIGWVSAEPSDLAGCPNTPCTAKIDTATGAFSGWFRALAGNSSNAGAWDGWISLSGTSPAYGPIVATDGTVSGFAWGSNSVGWIDFSKVASSLCARNTYSCLDANTQRYIDNSCVNHDTVCAYPSPTYGCVSGACTAPSAPAPGNGTTAIWVKPALIHTGTAVKVYWNVINVDASTCNVTGSNGDGGSGGWKGVASSTSIMTSSLITVRTTYTVSCKDVADSSTYTSSATVSLAPDFQEK